MPEPLVTVIITNYNHEAFVAYAIESAFAQSYEALEVVVVDDGSTDNSRSVIERYAQRIVIFFKSNGGQASAINAGFARSAGEIVTFLDSDDTLLEDSVARVVNAFNEHPNAGLVQSRVEVIDEAGIPLGVIVPAVHIRMPNGDLRARVDAFTNNAWWSPMSGLSSASEVLRQVLPLPEDQFRVAADHALCRASALCAPVVSLEHVGAYYRSHGTNVAYMLESVDVEKVWTDLTIAISSHRYLRDFARTVGVERYPADPDRQLDTLTQRLVLLKLGSAEQRLAGDKLLRVAWHGVRAALRRSDIPATIKLVHAGWFVAMAVAPRVIARWVAERALLRNNRRFLDGVMARITLPRSRA